MTTLNDFALPDIDGQPKNLQDYAGQVVLVVNVASRCGLTPQYSALEALYREYRDRGFTVLGFPCNQFAGQEPGSEQEIKQFCESRYDVSFPLFGKIDVNGDDRAPLYTFLTSAESSPDGPGDIKWNFAKFLVDRQGHVAARFSPTVAPDSDEVRQAIEKLL